jgi:anaerobic magnesium-protoporphyrin IX monomethyl ester cyclase
MRILFVYSLDDIRPVSKPLRTWSSMQFGISYISSLLKVHGHQTRLLVLGSSYYNDGKKQLETFMEEFNPGLICFTAVYSQYLFIEEMAQFAKRHWPDTYRIIGGVHATLQPDVVITGPFNAVCIGEGEYPVLELCQQLESQRIPKGIANLWLKTVDGSIEKNPSREFIQDLDLLPFPDHVMWEPWMRERYDDEMVILGGRGCPYDCTYCSNHALRNAANGHYVRMRSPENILAEVEYLYRTYPHRTFFFEIETLDCCKSFTIELCRKLADFNASIPDPVSFGSNYRINPQTIDEHLFSALENAHFSIINIGLESGSETIRRNILKRNYTNDDFLKVVSLARKHRLKVFVFNMIGVPGESLSDYKETVRLNRLVQPDGHFTGIFFPYPGTALYTLCIEQGLIQKTSSAKMERRQPMIRLPNFSEAQIKSAYIWFDYHVYKGFRPIWKILAQVALVKISSRPTVLFLFQKADQVLESSLFSFLRFSVTKHNLKTNTP